MPRMKDTSKPRQHLPTKLMQTHVRFTRSETIKLINRLVTEHAFFLARIGALTADRCSICGEVDTNTNCNKYQQPRTKHFIFQKQKYLADLLMS